MLTKALLFSCPFTVILKWHLSVILLSNHNFPDEVSCDFVFLPLSFWINNWLSCFSTDCRIHASYLSIFKHGGRSTQLASSYLIVDGGFQPTPLTCSPKWTQNGWSACLLLEQLIILLCKRILRLNVNPNRHRNAHPGFWNKFKIMA